MDEPTDFSMDAIVQRYIDNDDDLPPEHAQELLESNAALREEVSMLNTSVDTLKACNDAHVAEVERLKRAKRGEVDGLLSAVRVLRTQLAASQAQAEALRQTLLGVASDIRKEGYTGWADAVERGTPMPTDRTALDAALADAVEARESIIIGLHATMKNAAEHLDHNIESCGDEWVSECMRRSRDALFEALGTTATTDDEAGRVKGGLMSFLAAEGRKEEFAE